MAMFGWGSNPYNLGASNEFNNLIAQYPETQQVPQQVAKPKFFGEGGAGRAIAGYIGDALLASAGQKPIYSPTMMQRRENEDAIKKAMMLEQFKASYRTPTAAQQNYQYYQGLPEQQRNTFMEFIRSQNQSPYMTFGGQPYVQQQPDRAMLNGRVIVVRNNQWVYEDNGQPAQ